MRMSSEDRQSAIVFCSAEFGSGTGMSVIIDRLTESTEFFALTRRTARPEMLRKVEVKKSTNHMTLEVVDAIHPLMEVELSVDVMEIFPNSNTIA